VLVPGELMPLHIFEERYKSLVTDCREDDGEFALLYSDAEGARELGTTARVVEVLETFDDGRMNIVIRGGEVIRHFYTGEITSSDPGQDPRGAPDPAPLWTILDLTPEGRGADWYPKLSYDR